MSLSPAQIEDIREIALLDSYDYAANLCARLNAVQETATVADIAEWQKVRNKFTLIKGDGVDIDKSRNRLGIINRVRRRLGLPGLDSEAETSANAEICFSSPSRESEIVCD